MYHFVTFMILIRDHYFPVGLTTGPYVRGHVGFDTTHGLVAFLRLWAQHRAAHIRFYSKAWGVKTNGSLAGSTLHRIHLRYITGWFCQGQVFLKWGAYIGHQLITTVTLKK